MLSLIGGGILINRLLGHPFSNRRIAGLGLALITFASLAGWMIAHGDVDWITGVSRGLSALACAGLPPGGVPAATDRVLLLLLFPISMIGSLGLIALLGLITRRRDVSDDGHFHARRVIAVRLAAYLVCTLSVVWLIENVSGANLLDLPRASALALSSLGYGLPVERMANFPRGVDAIVLIFMLLSAGTLSATGGMGIAWLITLPSRWTNWVLIGIGVQIALIVTAYLMLSQTEPQLPADRLAILAVSGGMNVGISHEPVSITGPGLLTLSGLMLAGRLLPLLWVAALIRRKA
jgi:hypothetical protein